MKKFLHKLVKLFDSKHCCCCCGCCECDETKPCCWYNKD